VKEWVSEGSLNSSPCDILREIGKASKAYGRVLGRIADELETLLREPESELDENPELSEMTAAMLEAHDLQNEFNAACEAAEDVQNRIAKAETKIEALKSELAFFQKLESQQSFEIFKSEKQNGNRKDGPKAYTNSGDASPRSKSRGSRKELGQGRHLREEIARVTLKLQEERLLHERHARNQAIAQVAEMKEND
jgi:hypothetical protein